MKKFQETDLDPGSSEPLDSEHINETLADQVDQITSTQEYAAKSSDVKDKKVRRKLLLRYAIVAAIFAVITLLTPIILPVFPLWSVVPAIFLLGYIFITRQVFESLALSIILGFLMVTLGAGGYVDTIIEYVETYPESGIYEEVVTEEVYGFFDAINHSLLNTVSNEDTAWLFIVCGLMGSFVAIIEKAGGVYAFGSWVARRAKTRRSTLLWTWLLGLFIFVDDYLNSLTVGSCMSPLTDKHKVSREYLAYVVDSTAAPNSVLIPVSTWVVFIVGLFTASVAQIYPALTAGESKSLAWSIFLRNIPFNFYAWFSLLIVPLTIFGIIPIIGRMKKAERRAQETGVLAPPGSEKIDIRAGETLKTQKNAKVFNFFIPIIILILTTILFGWNVDEDTGRIFIEPDLQYGVIFTLGFMFIFYIIQGLINADEFFTLMIKGFKNMLMPLIMVVLAYMLADSLEQLHFMEFVTSAVTGNIPIWLLPVLIFLIFGLTEFIMGLSWGMYIIAIPVIAWITLTWPGIEQSQNYLLASVSIAACISAGVWGSHICFYSDATILSSSASGCDNFEHAITQLPYGVIAAILSVISFLLVGIILF